ncbi:MAG TPA: tyrosine-protein phosphatase [Armatimonadota bacterium]|nr:tyrosine-protein phosphatase [Armatimonadota bacterium]
MFPMTVMVHRLTLLRFLVLMLLGTVVGVSTQAVSKDPAGLSNFHQVNSTIYRGGAPTKTGLQYLQKIGIHTIIDLRISPKEVKAEKKMATEMGFTWLNIPMGREAPTSKQVATFLSTLAKSDDEPVFVHCQYGADRTGCMIGIYRVTVQGWSFTQAWTEMRKYGFKPYLDELKEAVRSRATQK